MEDDALPSDSRCPQGRAASDPPTEGAANAWLAPAHAGEPKPDEADTPEASGEAAQAAAGTPVGGWLLHEALQAVQAEHSRGTHLHWLAVARLLQAAQPDREPLGHGVQATHDALKVEHSHVFGFAPREVSLVQRPTRDEPAGGRATLLQDAVGLLGPNGPLPYAWTQYLFELSRPDLAEASPRVEGAPEPPQPKLTRSMAQQRAESFLAFINVLQRRHLGLFVRAWLETRAETAFDPFAERYPHPLTQRLSALAGLTVVRDAHSPQYGQAQDSVPDDFKRAYASVISRRVKSPRPLEEMISRHFDLPVRIEEFVPRWIQLMPDERTTLGRSFCGLGTQAMLGERCWDARQSFRVLLGPMSYARYRQFLPGQPGYARVRDLVATGLGAHWHWELVPLLAHDEIPAARLTVDRRKPEVQEPSAQPSILGLASWLGRPPGGRPAADLKLPMQAELRPRASEQPRFMPEAA